MSESTFQSHRVLNKRRVLRNNMTPYEKILWQYLRKKQLGFKFQRQYSIGNFIVDFYCSEKRLAIEVDGIHHQILNAEYDKQRTEFINQFNIIVLRFTNEEVFTNIEKVIDEIQNYIYQ